MLDYVPTESIHLSVEFLVRMSLYITIGAYAIFTGVLYYHWKNYSGNLKVSASTLLVYFVSTLPLVFVMIALSLNI